MYGYLRSGVKISMDYQYSMFSLLVLQNLLVTSCHSFRKSDKLIYVIFRKHWMLIQPKCPNLWKPSYFILFFVQHFMIIFIFFLQIGRQGLGNHYCLLGFSLKYFFIFGLQQANPISDKFFFHSHMAIMMKLRHQPQPQLPLL